MTVHFLNNNTMLTFKNKQKKFAFKYFVFAFLYLLSNFHLPSLKLCFLFSKIKLKYIWHRSTTLPPTPIRPQIVRLKTNRAAAAAFENLIKNTKAAPPERKQNSAKVEKEK